MLSYTLLPGGSAPFKATPHSVGFDLSCVDSVSIPPGDTVSVPLGIRFHMPQYWGLLHPRSYLSIEAPHLNVRSGIVDPDFTGEVSVVVTNTSSCSTWTCPANTRLVQIVFVHVNELGQTLELVDTEKFDSIVACSTRGYNGFGSSGKIAQGVATRIEYQKNGKSTKRPYTPSGEYEILSKPKVSKSRFYTKGHVETTDEVKNKIINMKVLNMKDIQGRLDHTQHRYIGRGPNSIFGNAKKLTLSEYQDYAREELWEYLDCLVGYNLVCFCEPKDSPQRKIDRDLGK